MKEIKGILNTKKSTKKKQKIVYKTFGKYFIPGLVGICIRNNLISSIIMHSILPTAVGFSAKLGFKQHDITMTKEQSVLKNVMNICKRKDIATVSCFRL